VYGVPQYVSALQSAWLNESATLFRRRYYLNGSHAGFILYMTDTASNVNDVDKLREAMRNSKGPGNFRNLFVYAPGGKKDGLQILPVSEIAAKDEFFNIKNCTRDDVLAAHRVPPQLLGTMPNNTGGFGDVTKAAAVFGCNEIEPLQAQFLSVNEWAGQEVVRFRPINFRPTRANNHERSRRTTRTPASIALSRQAWQQRDERRRCNLTSAATSAMSPWPLICCFAIGIAGMIINERKPRVSAPADDTGRRKRSPSTQCVLWVPVVPSTVSLISVKKVRLVQIGIAAMKFLCYAEVINLPRY
jgi:hypothetical protein